MAGRTPEYVGKKIDSREMKLAMLFLLISPAVRPPCNLIRSRAGAAPSTVRVLIRCRGRGEPASARSRPTLNLPVYRALWEEHLCHLTRSSGIQESQTASRAGVKAVPIPGFAKRSAIT